MATLTASPTMPWIVASRFSDTPVSTAAPDPAGGRASRVPRACEARRADAPPAAATGLDPAAVVTALVPDRLRLTEELALVVGLDVAGSAAARPSRRRRPAVRPGVAAWAAAAAAA